MVYTHIGSGCAWVLIKGVENAKARCMVVIRAILSTRTQQPKEGLMLSFFVWITVYPPHESH